MSSRVCSFMLAALVALAPTSAARADVSACLDTAESAQALRANGQLVEAKQGFIACAAVSCPAPVRADCTRWLAEVEQALPSVVVRVHDEGGRDVLTAALQVDGKRAALDGRPFQLNPGKHVFRVEVPGRPAREEAVVVRQSERDRIVSIGISAETVRREPPARARGPVPLGSWLLFGGGVAALGAGGVLSVLGSGEHADLERSCAPTSSCSHDDVTSARTKLIGGDVLLGVGIVAVGVGLYLALTRGPRAALGAPVVPRF